MNYSCRFGRNSFYVIYNLFKLFEINGYCKFNILKIPFDYVYFLKEYSRYTKLNNNPHFYTDNKYIYPCLYDNTSITPIEPTYFFQDTWAAKKFLRTNQNTITILAQKRLQWVLFHNSYPQQ